MVAPYFGLIRVQSAGFLFLVAAAIFTGGGPSARAELVLERLPENQIQQVKVILQKLAPMIKAREAEETLATLRFDELYAPLAEDERAFVREFQKFDPIKAGIQTHWHGIADGKIELKAVQNQTLRKDGKPFVIPTQYVPPKVYKAYILMMDAMQQDLGKRLYIESAYRSSAYQLYLFLSYLQNHDYSVRETAHWNAFPGYSEHGNPKRQALDFINETAISGEQNSEDFATLEEYQWLLQHGPAYGFELSFPKKDPQGIGFEPWHWRYVGKKARKRGLEEHKNVKNPSKTTKLPPEEAPAA